MDKESLYHQDQKRQNIKNQELSDKIIQQMSLQSFHKKSKVALQSKNNHNQSYIGHFQIIASIPHLDCINIDHVEFHDYITIKQKSPSKNIKITEFKDQYSHQENTKKKIYLLCRSQPLNQHKLSLDFYELRKLIQEAILSDNKQKKYPNLIFPANSMQSIINSKQQLFTSFNISTFSSIISNIDTFYPLRNMAFSKKFQSQLYCLNLFYRFLLTIAKPLFKIINTVHENYDHLIQTIECFFLECLIIENVFYQQISNQFYLFCNQQRFQQKKQKNTSNNQLRSRKQKPKSIQQIEKKFLSNVSLIFWTLFFPLSNLKDQSKESLQLHNTFMSNFLAAIRHGELTFQQTLQIMQSKQKRKSFINSKIQISQSKHQNHHHFFIGKRKLSIQPRYSETIDVNLPTNSMNNFQVTKGAQNNIEGHKKRSVKRKLNEKRNTIDVMFQNYFTNKNIPPSFQNRSLQKKGRLFKHQKSVNKSKSRDRSIQSCFGNTQKESLENYSLNYSSSKKKSISSYDPQIKNSRYNLIDKLVNRQVSKTIQIAEINLLQAKLKQNTGLINNKTVDFQNQKQGQNDALQKFQSFSFIKTNPKSSKIYLKNSTQKLKGQTLNIQLNHHNVTYLNSKENIFIKTGSVSNPTNQYINPSKKQNRRYYYHPNNFTSNMMDNQSIKRLIQDQLELYRTVQTEKSRQKHLLNKSQQKALANFNREFKKNVKKNEEENSLSTSKSKEFNVKISKNLSNIIKKDKNTFQTQGKIDQNNFHPNSELKRILGNKRSSFHSREFIETFSPPKSKKKNNTQVLRAQFSPNFVQDKNLSSIHSKIDDKEFKAKISSYFTTDVNAFYKNTIESSIKVINKIEDQTQISNINKNTVIELKQTPQNKNPNKFNLSLQQNSQIQKPNINQQINLNQIEKIENQYFIDDQNQNQMRYPSSQKNQVKKVSLDRTQKSLINAAKKLNKKINNQNFNVQQIFVEQQAISKAQQQLRRSSDYYQKKDETEVHQQQKFIKDKINQNSIQHEVSQSNKIEVLEEMQNMISPIKHFHVPNSQKTFIELQKENDFDKKQSNILDNKDYGNQSKTQELVSRNTSNQNIQKSNQILQSNLTDNIKNTVDFINSQNDSLKVKKNTFNDLSKEQIKDEIQQVKTIQRNPILNINKKQLTQSQQKKHITFYPDIKKNQLKQTTISNQIKKNTQPKEPKTVKTQSIKQTKTQPKQKTKVIDEQDFELEQIKLTPIQNPKNQIKIPTQSNQKKTIESESQKSQKSFQDKKIPSNKINEEIKSQKKINSLTNQPPLPPKINQQAYQPQNIQTSDKRARQSNRQNTSKSSQASSYGPHKSVKKIVQQYVFFVNRIGQAVAKSALVSKKVQKVCEWYVGVYFLYKRFFYERRKIEKFLKQGTPKLTRYDEEMNKDEWLLYLKSNDRQQLLKKVTDQNVKITQSIQKMQGKLMGRKVPDEIKRFSAISQRSSQQSLIAVQAVIDEFDALTDKGMLNDEQILCHCTSLLNACLVLAELDQLVEDIVPISELVKPKRTPEQLETIAQDLFDLYHGEDQDSAKQ